MKKILVLVMACLAMLMLAGCSSTEMLKPSSLTEVVKGEYLDDEVGVVVFGTPGMLHVGVVNNTDGMVTFDVNRSVAVVGGEAVRLIDGETRMINSNLAQATYSVVPGTTVTRQLFPEKFQGVAFANATSLTLTLVVGGEDKLVNVPLAYLLVDEDGNVPGEYVGTVSWEGSFWQPLFIGSPTSKMEERLTEEAYEQYGPQAMLGSIDYSQDWSFKSIILYFNLLGYVVNAEGEADVYLPAGV